MISHDSGHIVTVASLAGLNGINRLVDYCSSKFAAVGFDEALRAELAVSVRYQDDMFWISFYLLFVYRLTDETESKQLSCARISSRRPCFMALNQSMRYIFRYG